MAAIDAEADAVDCPHVIDDAGEDPTGGAALARQLVDDRVVEVPIRDSVREPEKLCDAPRQAEAVKLVRDLSAFRFITNFVRQKRKTDP